MRNLKSAKILLTGGRGFLGSYVYDELLRLGLNQANIYRPSSKEFDLRKAKAAEKVVKNMDVVLHLAAKVGGIGFNQKHPAELFYDNAIMGLNIIESARKEGVKKFVQIGTVCSYPKILSAPFKEKMIWEGYPEETNAPYGLAKKMLLVQLQSYRKQYGFNGIYLIPTNLYGPKDNFDLNDSHVIPALINKFINATENKLESVSVWGNGKATREFLFVEDAARAIVIALRKYDGREPINLGSGEEISIKNLVELIARLVGYRGGFAWEVGKPNGQPRRYVDTTRTKEILKFQPKVSLELGLIKTIKWYRQNHVKKNS